MANGLEKEKALIAALRRYLDILTNDVWDQRHCIDGVVQWPREDLIGTPFFRRPIALQITWNRDNWDKRTGAIEKVSQIANNLTLLEINSEEVTPLIVFGVFTALSSLWLNSDSPDFVLIEVTADGNYRISDLLERWESFTRRIKTSLLGREFRGRLVCWNGTHGFIDADIPTESGSGSELFTFFCSDRHVESVIVERFAGAGHIDEARQPTVAFINNGLGFNKFRGQATRVRLLSNP
ncbi:MAG: hypothetical protein WC702_01270 [Patescibacteria group bacterium]|jgi:hypothetical protein